MSIRKATLRDWCANLGTSLSQATRATTHLAARLDALEKKLSGMEEQQAHQTAQDTSTGPSTPSPVGDYPPAPNCPPAASMGVAWGVSERAEERLIELTREAIRDDLVGRRDARYLGGYMGRGPGQLK